MVSCTACMFEVAASNATLAAKEQKPAVEDPDNPISFSQIWQEGSALSVQHPRTSFCPRSVAAAKPPETSKWSHKNPGVEFNVQSEPK
eukprot:6167304-Amphidinium_carterae.1